MIAIRREIALLYLQHYDTLYGPPIPEILPMKVVIASFCVLVLFFFLSSHHAWA